MITDLLCLPNFKDFHVGKLFSNLSKELSALAKFAVLQNCAAAALTALRYLADGEHFDSRDYLTFNNHWHLNDGLTFSLLLCVAAGIVGYSKSGRHLAIKLSTTIFSLYFAFGFLDFECGRRITENTFRYDGLLTSWMYLSFAVEGIVFCAIFYYCLALGLLWLVRRFAMAIRAARELRCGYQDKTNLIFAANTVLIFVGGEDEGGGVALDIRDSIEHVRGFNPPASRRRYLSSAAQALPALALSPMRTPNLRVNSNSR